MVHPIRRVSGSLVVKTSEEFMSSFTKIYLVTVTTRFWQHLDKKNSSLFERLLSKLTDSLIAQLPGYRDAAHSSWVPDTDSNLFEN